MEFSLSEDQRAIADLAAGVFADFCSDEALRQHAESGAPMQAELWNTLVASGLHALALPESLGGSGLGMLDLAQVLEQQGRHVAALPLWSSQLAAMALAQFGDEEQRELLPALLAGERLATVALADLHDVAGGAVQAEPVAGGWRLQGLLAAVPWAAESQHLLLVASGQLFFMPLASPGITQLAGVYTEGEPCAELRLEGVSVPAGACLGPHVAWLEQRAIACLAALQLGVAEEALRRTAEYVSERKQFERPVGSFQGVALRAADGYIDVEAMRSTLWQLCWRLDQGLPAEEAARVAKYWACEGGHRIAHTGQHLHGGMGADVTYPIHRYFIWARALEMRLGGASAQLAALGALLASDERTGVMV